MSDERRRHKRFSATAFLNRPVHLAPLPPYFGHALKGKLIDLSAGGMSILIDESIPTQSFFALSVTFPDSSQLETVSRIVHVVPRGRHYLHGIEFLTVPPEIKMRIEKMSTDYIDCEGRIRGGESNVCRTDCAFFSMCTKPHKIDPVVDLDAVIDLTFKLVEVPKDLPAA